MKLKSSKTSVTKASSKAVEPERRIGRPVTVGDERINLFVSPDDRKQVDDTIRRSRDLSKGEKLTLSYIFREGARRFCVHLNAQLDKATKGEFHAKRRSKMA